MQSIGQLFDMGVAFALKNAIGVVFLVMAFAYMWVAKLINDRMDGFNVDHAIVEDSNFAVSLRRAGFYLAIALGMYGAITGPSAGFLTDVWVLAIDGACVVLFLIVARVLNDAFIVHGLDNTKAVREGNVAVGVVEFFGYLATGLLAKAAFEDSTGGPLSVAVFFGFGQLVLIITARVYEWTHPWNGIQNVREGNLASGLMLGGILLAVSIAMHDAIHGGIASWERDIFVFALRAGVAIFLMVVVASKTIDRLFLPKTTVQIEIVRDKNVAAITVVVALRIAAALGINAAVV